MKLKFSQGVNTAIFVLTAGACWAEDKLVTDRNNNYGSPGNLLDMPTAEMAPVGQFTTSVSHHSGATKTQLVFQATNRFSASFRYAGLKGVYSGSNNSTYYDRSFDLKFRLVNEGQYLPAIAVGMQDFVGTGLYGAEYLVATKSIGDRLRFTTGIGWGRLGSYGSFSHTGHRPATVIGKGGVPTIDRWFQGDMAAFAGFSFQATDKLTFSVEYSSDGYDSEVRDGVIKHKTPFNFGANYKLSDSLALSTYYLHGDEVGVSATFSINARKPLVNGGAESAPVPVAVRAKGASADLGWTQDTTTQISVRDTIASSLKTEGMSLQAFDMNATTAHVVIHNGRFDMRSEAVGRTARILTRVLPASVETLTISQSVEGIPTSSVTFKRSDLEQLENAPAADILNVARFTDPAAENVSPAVFPGAYPRFEWGIGPYMDFSAFDPKRPLRVVGGIALYSEYRFAPGWMASGALHYKVLGSLGKIGAGERFNQPRVRSTEARYAAEDNPTIDHLTMAKYFRPGKNFYGRVTAGYLEKMYAGASAELLWKPVDSRLALGAEVNYVRPRDYNQLFGIRTRNTSGGRIPEWNGHVSGYYDIGYGFHGQLNVGRYLAGDWGATLSLDREFANGWRIGAYATKTNVSSSSFGEGSFDKGIRITIPFSFVSGQPTQRRSSVDVRSLSRDGGSRLHVKGRLYEMIRETHRPEMEKTWGKFWR